MPYRTSRFGPLSVSLLRILAGPDGYFTQGNIRDHMNRLLNLKVPFCGPDGYEVGHWDSKFSVLDDPAFETLEREALRMGSPTTGSFYAWLDSHGWDYDPRLVIYNGDEFRAIFLDACINLCKEWPHLESEYLEALDEMGLLQR
ncbi:hypothetical protein ACQ859_23520 [Roseateles chitinivorans]|uniref:hypothetical protein n=1 Tax=Roseateles chitinivorans TaxID=2917965 RepID=UPI003D6732D3